MRVISVIPAIRVPRTLGHFDYSVPDGMEIAVGDLIRVPFRKRVLVGVVRAIRADGTERDLKTIERPLGLRFNERTMALLDRLAAHAFSSPANVLFSWIGSPPKRIPGFTQKKKRRKLILVPWTGMAKEHDVPIQTGDLPAGKRFAAWAGFLSGETPELAATRMGAWLAAEADEVMLYEPENDDHKQDELAPRYDARWIADQAEDLGVKVTRIGLTPRVGGDMEQIPPIDLSFHAIDLSSRDWSDVAGLQNRTLTMVEEAYAAEQPVTIIHPIHGERARLRCADCGWDTSCPRCGAGPTAERDRLVCHRCHWHGDAILQCPSCGGMRLSKSRPGRDAMTRNLVSRGMPNVRVVSLTEWNGGGAGVHAPLLVLTDLSLLSGGVEDARRRERLIIAFRRFAERGKRMNADLVVQGSAELLADAKSWLTSDGCRVALERELEERRAFHLPPTVRLIKLICRGSVSSADAVKKALLPGAMHIPNATIAGPYPVEHLPGSRTPRWVIHATVPLQTTQSAIQTLLAPVLNTNVLIDLDPVAFFE